MSGLDRIAREGCPELEGKRLAALTNHTALDARGRHLVEVLGEVPGARIACLMSPEHGLWSTHQDMEPVDGEPPRDPVFGLPVLSLYGRDQATLRPRPEALEGIDALVFDIQDIGSRYYTYAATLALAMEAAAQADVPVMVLDRPNPIGEKREGPLLRPGFESFCGLEPGLPIRYGMTVGALARWYLVRRAPSTQLTVIPALQEVPARWVPPSPNMPTRDTALVYPGMCLLEATTVSEGRGTTTPFLLFGAPGIDPIRLCRRLREREIPGVSFAPRRFRPELQKHRGSVCGGAYLQVTDPAALPAVDLGVWVLDALMEEGPPSFGWRTEPYEFVHGVPAIDLLWGSPELREVLQARRDPSGLCTRARSEAEAFVP
jgi:uncharacterized protein YbbC (DUF1343 family)